MNGTNSEATNSQEMDVDLSPLHSLFTAGDACHLT